MASQREASGQLEATYRFTGLILGAAGPNDFG